MRQFILFLALIAMSCDASSTEDMFSTGNDPGTTKPKTRTVFFGEGILEVAGKAKWRFPVNVMFDTVTPTDFTALCSREKWDEMAEITSWLDNSSSLQPISFNTTYTYYPIYTYESWSSFNTSLCLLIKDKDHKNVIYQDKDYPWNRDHVHRLREPRVVDLSQQRKITGRPIDVVVGTNWTFVAADNYPSWEGIWATPTVTDKNGKEVGIFEFYEITDQMIVPYDWGWEQEQERIK